MREFLSGGFAGVILTAGILGCVHLRSPDTIRTQQFENDAVKAWKTAFPAGSSSTMHRHDHPRVVVALTAGRLDSIDDNGVTPHLDWEAGHAYWLPAMPPGAMHKDANPGGKPMEVVVLELQKEK